MVVKTFFDVLFRGDLQTTLLRYFFRLRSVDLGVSAAAAAPSDALSPGLELNLSLQTKKSDGSIYSHFLVCFENGIPPQYYKANGIPLQYYKANGIPPQYYKANGNT